MLDPRGLDHTRRRLICPHDRPTVVGLEMTALTAFWRNETPEPPPMRRPRRCARQLGCGIGRSRLQLAGQA